MVRQRIEEGVGRRVVSLARVAENARGRREHDERVEVHRLGLLVQQPRAERLGLHDGGETFRRQLGQQRVVDDHGQVEYALERTPDGADLREQPLHIFGRSGIGFDSQRFRAHAAKLVDESRRAGRVGALASGQHKMPRPAVGQPAGQDFAESAEPARDEVGRVRIDRERLVRRLAFSDDECFGEGEEDFADVLACGHEPERGVRAARGERAEGQWPQGAGLDEGRDFAQQLARQFLVSRKHGVHRDHVEGRVAAQVPHGQLRVLVDVALADLDEAAEFREAGKPHRDGLGGERVEHDVHAASAGEFHDPLGEVAAARVDDMPDAHGREQRALVRAAGRRDDFGPEVLRDLDGRHADAPETGMHQNGLAFAQPRDIFQRMPRGHEHHGDRGRLFEAHAVGEGQHVGAARQRVRCEPEHREAENPVARLHVIHALADRDHLAGHFVAEHAGVRRFRRVKAERFEHVAEIEGCRLDADEHLAGAAGRHFERRELQAVEAPAFPRLQAQGHRRIERLLDGLQAAAEPLHVARVVAERHFAFRFVAKKLAPKLREVGGRRFALQVDRAACPVRVLAEENAEKADGRPLGRGDRPDLAPGRLGAARHEIDADLAHGRECFQRVAEVDKLRRAHQRVRVLVAVRPIEVPEIDEPLGRVFGGPPLDEFAPIFRHIRAHAKAIGVALRAFAARHDAAACALRAQQGCQGGSGACFVREHDPRLFLRSTFDSRIRRQGRRGILAREQDDLRLAALRVAQARQTRGFRESGLAQHPLPLLARQEGLVGAQVVVGDAPPTAGQSEDRLGPKPRAADVHERERAARGKQSVDATQRRAHIGGGVEDVGADDEVEASRLEPLVLGIAIEVERPVFDFGVSGELLLRRREKPGRYIAENVVVKPAFELRQDAGREAARARPHLEDAQAASVRQGVGRAAHRGGDPGHARRGEKSVAVILFEQIGAGAAEEHLHGVLLAAQDRREFRRGGRAEQGLRHMAGKPPDKIAQHSRRRIRGPLERFVRLPAVAASFQQPAVLQMPGEPFEDAPRSGRDAEGRGGKRSLSRRGARPHAAEAGGDLRCREGVLLDHDGLEVIRAAQPEHLVQRARRPLAQIRQRGRFQRPVRGFGRRPLPVNMVNKIAPFAGRGSGAAHRGKGHGAEAVHQDARFAAVVI